MKDPTTYLSTSAGAFRVIHQGVPISVDKFTPSAAVRVAEVTGLSTCFYAVWNGDRSEWVEYSTLYVPAITKVRNDRNGNSRRVIHFLDLEPEPRDRTLTLSERYEAVLKAARRLGGKRFHNKQFGGGVVFQACTDDEVLEIRHRLLAGF